MTTATDINTGRIITVKPIAICQSDACDTLLIADANTGKGIWIGYDLNWQIDLDHEIKCVYGKGCGKQTACRPRF